MSHLWWILSLFLLAYDHFKFWNQFFFASWKFGWGVRKFIFKFLYSKWSARRDQARTSIKIFWPNFLGGGAEKAPTFFSRIPFVGCLNLCQEKSDSLQKESAQTDLPRPRKLQKTEFVPPLGGGRKCPPTFVRLGYSLWGVYTWGKWFLSHYKRNWPKPSFQGWLNGQGGLFLLPRGGTDLG